MYFFNDSLINKNKLFAFSCDRCIRRYNNKNQLYQYLRKNHNVDFRILSYINLIHYINVYSFITREYIKIIVRIFDDKRFDMYLNNDNMIFLIDNKLVKNINFTFYIIKNINLIDVDN